MSESRGPGAGPAPSGPDAGGPSAGSPAPGGVAGIHPNVVALGFTSLLTDISSEMLVPVMPLFVTATLGASVASLGWIEGVAEATASALRLVSGRVSDRIGHRKPFLVAGYGLSGACKTAMAWAASWTVLLGLRFGDRVGKALRNPPRDALIADSTPAPLLGRAFGLHRAMDTAGAAMGPLVAWWLLARWSHLGAEGYRRIFLVSAIPAALAVAVLAAFVRAPRVAAHARAAAGRATTPLGARFRRFVAADALFQLGNSSMAFLLLRSQHAGFSAGEVALVYLGYNLLAAALAFPFGGLSDRVGRRPLLLAGYLVYALAYWVAAFSPGRAGAVIAFALLAVHTALADGQARSLVADLVPRERRATAYGVYHAVVGAALLPASIVAGLLWERVGPQAPFALGALLALAAAVALAALLPSGSDGPQRAARA
jgi:MFS family permease